MHGCILPGPPRPAPSNTGATCGAPAPHPRALKGLPWCEASELQGMPATSGSCDRRGEATSFSGQSCRRVKRPASRNSSWHSARNCCMTRDIEGASHGSSMVYFARSQPQGPLRSPSYFATSLIVNVGPAASERLWASVRDPHRASNGAHSSRCLAPLGSSAHTPQRPALVAPPPARPPWAQKRARRPSEWPCSGLTDGAQHAKQWSRCLNKAARPNRLGLRAMAEVSAPL